MLVYHFCGVEARLRISCQLQILFCLCVVALEQDSLAMLTTEAWPRALIVCQRQMKVTQDFGVRPINVYTMASKTNSDCR
ncbi:hypothetical protein IQ07DRAFT_352144 [Pyrenochaeta sp. DS3sAY3a]|nr:hypothetical protein IQ07DRAFT_352144 [Pyrenochaeta sp. DS3sAY3a]